LTDFTADYNFVCGAAYAPKHTGTVRSTFCFVEAHGVNGGNPLFISVPANDYPLQLTSPLINAGLALPYFNTDFRGSPRPTSQWDIGAFQHSFVPAPANLRIAVGGL
jgi:hypothetical protein